MEEMTSKFLLLKNTTQTEILNVRDAIQAQAEKDRNQFNNSAKYEKRLGDLENMVASLEDQIKKRGRSSPESSRIGTNESVLNELDRRINEVNESVRVNLKIMDVNLVEMLRDKEEAIKRLANETTSLKTTVGILSDHITKLERMLQTKVDEGQLSKIIEPHLASASKGDFNASQSRVTANVEQNLDAKIKEIENILTNVALIEKDFRGKYELYDLNLSSIKRHMELDLTMTLKQNIVPLQKNVESYLQGVESRIAYLEDVVTKEIRRESFILPNDRDQTRNKHSKYGGVRDSLNFGDNLLESQLDGRRGEGGQGTRGNSHENTIRESAFGRVAASNIHNIQTHESVRIDDEEPQQYRNTQKNEPLTNTANHMNQDSFNPKTSSLSGSIRTVESRSSPLPLLHDLPVATKSNSAFKMLYKDLNKKQTQEKTIKTSKDTQKPRSQLSRYDEPQESQPESRHERLQAEESNTIEGLSGLLTNENDVSLSSGKLKKPTSTQQSHVLEQKGDLSESASKRGKEPQDEEEQEDNFQGNIKGLLKRSRQQRENAATTKEDPRQNQPQGGKSLGPRSLASEPIYDPRQPAGYNQGFPQKGGLGANKRPLPLQQEDPNPLPPLNVKGGKNLNQNKYPQSNAGPARNQPQRGPGGYGRGDPFNRPYMVDPQIDEVQEGEDVEEIVYHVNEEGYLVDEYGNFLVDEEGNYIQLSPEQMQEIEENEMIYDEQEEDYYQ